jgi:non-ribosomal peptide synthetase component F
VDPRDLCLHELIVKQARRTPEEPAVVDERTSLSYEELDLRAERLAAYLRDAGVREDTVVGVYMERRVEYVVACLAAMKAGGAFCPWRWPTRRPSSRRSSRTRSPLPSSPCGGMRMASPESRCACVWTRGGKKL